MEDIKIKLIEWIEHIGDIATEHLPDFALQIVSYTAFYYSTWMFVCLALAVFLGLLGSFTLYIIKVEASHVLKNEISYCYYTQSKETNTFCMIGITMLMIFFFICSSYYFCMMKKCEHAPKLVVMDYIRQK